MITYLIIDFFVLLAIIQNILRRKILIRWISIIINIFSLIMIIYVDRTLLENNKLRDFLDIYFTITCVLTYILSKQNGVIIKKDKDVGDNKLC